MKGTITERGPGYIMIYVPLENSYDIDRYEVTECEVELWDGRHISPEQRKKAYALLNEIAAWSGHAQEYLKDWFKYALISETGGEYFSLSDCTMTQAREYISYLIDFCLRANVPTHKPLLEYTDDIGAYLYACLANRKCAICGAKADVHHVDRVGMGRSRNDIIHEGMEAIALCRRHHQEAHQNEAGLFYKYKVYGIKLDAYLCRKLKLQGGENEHGNSYGAADEEPRAETNAKRNGRNAVYDSRKPKIQGRQRRVSDRLY